MKKSLHFAQKQCEQVCVQLRKSADNVTLAAGRRAAAPLLLSAGRAAKSIDISWPPGTQQQTRRSGVRRPNDGTDGQTDARQLH